MLAVVEDSQERFKIPFQTEEVRTPSDHPQCSTVFELGFFDPSGDEFTLWLLNLWKITILNETSS